MENITVAVSFNPRISQILQSLQESYPAAASQEEGPQLFTDLVVAASIYAAAAGVEPASQSSLMASAVDYVRKFV